MQRRIFVMINRGLTLVVRRLRLRRFRGANLLFLTTTGRKIGQPRTTPLLYLDDGDRWVVVASNAGADWEPGWWLNVRAGSPAHVDVGGRATPVKGTEITGDERELLWKRLNTQVLDYDSYQAKVRRRLAVVAHTSIRRTRPQLAKVFSSEVCSRSSVLSAEAVSNQASRCSAEERAETNSTKAVSASSTALTVASPYPYEK